MMTVSVIMPCLNEEKQIQCTGADGAKFFVSQQEVQEGANAVTGAKEAQCFGASGVTGTVDWTPALGKDSQGQVRKLTGSFIKPNGATVDVTPSPVVTVNVAVYVPLSWGTKLKLGELPSAINCPLLLVTCHR